MAAAPARPKIYHITHVDNLPSILTDGCLLSDAAIIARGSLNMAIGMSSIKKRRLEELEVTCHPGTMVGDYVPFYFCPRSIMLYVIYRRNRPGLFYQGGQGPIVHLEADLHEVVLWANEAKQRWAFSLANAGAFYTQTQFRASIAQLSEVDWTAVFATDFRSPEVNEGKQAEFLVHESFPWSLVSRIGVESRLIQTQAEAIIGTSANQPTVQVCKEWYYE